MASLGRVLKPKSELEKLAKGAPPSEFFVEGVLQRYERRVVDLESEEGQAILDMPLARFAAWYKLPTEAQVKKEEGGGDEEGADDEEDLPTHAEDPCPDGLPDIIHLEGGGFVTRRKRKACIRYHRFDPKKDSGEEFYYSTLVLFCPFQKEEEDLALASSGFSSYKAFSRAKEAQIKPLLREFEAFAGPIAKAYEELDRERQEAIESRLAANADGPSSQGDGPNRAQGSLSFSILLCPLSK